VPPQYRQAVGEVVRSAFTTALDRIIIVAAVIALVSGVVSLFTIRAKDFAAQDDPAAHG
jgi:hypothetical protein